MSDVMKQMFGEDDEDNYEVIDDDESYGYYEENEEENEEETHVVVVENKGNELAVITDNIDVLKKKYKIIKHENTKDYDEIRDEIKDLKAGNHKLLKDLMVMMEGNIQPQVLKSYSEIINSTVKLNQFILDIDDRRKENSENNIYEEMAEIEEKDTPKQEQEQIFRLSPSQLFGEMMDDVKELMMKQLKDKEKAIKLEEAEIIDDDK